VKLPWIATVRGRIGSAIDGALGALLYGTAGVAFTHASASATTAASGTIVNTSSTNVGWTAGLGGEAAFAQNWTARIEYLYIATDVKFSGPLGIGGTVSQTAKVSDNLSLSRRNQLATRQKCQKHRSMHSEPAAAGGLSR
jgi:opacity protein-like surface antigen